MQIVSISDGYDGGNIEFVEHQKKEGDQSKVILRIKPDPYTPLEKTHHSQYFSFRSCVTEPQTIDYVIENADKASYPDAWEGSTVFTTTSLNDENSWTRVQNTVYENGSLIWTFQHTTTTPNCYFAYFPPYSYDRHLALIDKCTQSPRTSCVMSLGKTLDGREMDCVKAGQGDMICWIIHRQHPGENMAEFFAEGLLTQLLGLDSAGSVDGLVSKLLSMYTFYIVPNMCPDGAVRGHLRTNAAGSNLNREWTTSIDKDGNSYEAPTMERSPEVYHVLQKMDETGVDAFMDIHGDEELPYNFLAGTEGVENWDTRQKYLFGALSGALCRANPDMQKERGYEPEESYKAMMQICSNQIASRFNCLAATLEMPFKDCKTNPDPERGWSPARAKKLGASVLHALAYVHPYLRQEGEFWKDFLPDDEYVRPV